MTVGNHQPALRALFACKSGYSEPEIGLEHPFVKFAFDLAIRNERSTTNGKIRMVLVCKNNYELF
jgi:hypothetical protein